VLVVVTVNVIELLVAPFAVTVTPALPTSMPVGTVTAILVFDHEVMLALTCVEP
jgi:hypothetical protein